MYQNQYITYDTQIIINRQQADHGIIALFALYQYVTIIPSQFIYTKKPISDTLGITLTTRKAMISTAIPDGFVYLKDIDATIIQSVRYATPHNFVGYPMPGYNSPQIICSQQAADALKKAHAELKKEGYQFVVYDGYRPQKTVDNFKNWRTDLPNDTTKQQFYPTLTKAEAFEQGFLTDTRSGHSRGSTFDLTIIAAGKNLHDIAVSTRTLKSGNQIPFLDDGTVNMGSSFDLFHTVSQHDSPLISSTDTHHREILRSIMKEHGFNDYHAEWWHYTLANEPFPTTYFDFGII